MSRFSDDQLTEFHDKFKEHVQKTDQQFEQQKELLNLVILAQKQNAEAVEKLTEETRDVVEWGNNIQGTINIGVAIQKFGAFISKWSLIGVGCYAAYEAVVKYITENFGK